MKLSDGLSPMWALYSLSFACAHPVQYLDSLPSAMSKSCPYVLCHALCFLTLLAHWDLFWLSQTTPPHLVWTVPRPWGRQVLLETRFKQGAFTFLANSCNYWETPVTVRHQCDCSSVSFTGCSYSSLMNTLLLTAPHFILISPLISSSLSPSKSLASPCREQAGKERKFFVSGGTKGHFSKPYTWLYTDLLLIYRAFWWILLPLLFSHTQNFFYISFS